MNGEQISDGIWYIGALVLVGASLLARRPSWRSTLGMIAAWAGILAVVLVIVSYRGELAMVAARVQSDITGTPRQQIEGKTLRIAMGPDGHYWVDAKVNGTTARFLIDSGATVTALSVETARAAGLRFGQDGRPPVVMETANGAVKADRSMIASLNIGPIHANDLPVIVSPSFGKVNVLGMNMLSQLSSWRVEHGEMILQP